jgi:hypothetical protein
VTVHLLFEYVVQSGLRPRIYKNATDVKVRGRQ